MRKTPNNIADSTAKAGITQGGNEASRWTRRSVLQVGAATTLAGLMTTNVNAIETQCSISCQGEARAWTLANLQSHVQAAVELELFTIPPYLTALYSLKQSASESYGLIRSVVVEEMLHLQLACNLLNAIGGQPRLTGDSAPSYPNPIPHIEPTYYIELGAASLQQMKAFMTIETPSYTKSEPSKTEHGPADSYATIGDFYAAVADGICCLGDDIFTGSSASQVTSYGSNDVVIGDVESALRAINVITDQGEGAPQAPHQDLDGIEGHYWRFEQVAAKGQSQFNADTVYPMQNNPGQQNVSEKLQRLSDFCDSAYTWLLQEIELGVNGDSARVGKTIGGLMYQVVQPLSIFMMEQKIHPDSDRTLGPRFSYQGLVTRRSLQADWDSMDEQYKADKTLREAAGVLGLELA